MSRASAFSSQNLSLTEELEKLEQSITLTLQGKEAAIPSYSPAMIDHNFSRAHQIVTTSILPVVEQYAEHSRAVWEGSKFWKQFFEASANVSLSGYEERPRSSEEVDVSHDVTATSLAGGEDEDDEENSYDESTVLTATNNNTIQLESSAQYTEHMEDAASVLDSPSLTSSTPRAKTGTVFAEYPSPYEALKREYQPGAFASNQTEPKTPMETAGAQQATAAVPTTQTPASQLPRSRLPQARQPAAATGGTAGKDVLLHRLLDKTYRIQATPHKNNPKITHPNETHARNDPTNHKNNKQPRRTAAYIDSSPPSSPDVPPPQLHAELFSPGTRNTIILGGRDGGVAGGTGGPRTPKAGVSVFETPGRRRTQRSSRHGGNGNSVRKACQSDGGGGGTAGAEDDDDDEDDVDEDWAGVEGMSPPKTIQFAVPPGRLLRTPAREASKRIISDLLTTAGADDTVTTSNDDEHRPGAAKDEAARMRRLQAEMDLTMRRLDLEDLDEMDCREGDGRGRGEGDSEDDEDVDVDDGLDVPGGEPTSPVVIRGRRDMAEDTF